MTYENDLWKKLSNKVAGKFIVLDGPDGCGKSTQVKLLADRLTALGLTDEEVRNQGEHGHERRELGKRPSTGFLKDHYNGGKQPASDKVDD